MSLELFLRLGRMSNLPTVWTNAMAGGVLAGLAGGSGAMLVAAIALSLFYVGGMWLNDAFDAETDAHERASRPIPEGRIGRGTVFAVGGALILAGVATGVVRGGEATLAGLALAGAIVLYDWTHKRTVLGPVIMGGARALSYGFAAAIAGGVNGDVLVGALGLMAYVVGLTYAARQEAYDRIGRAWPLTILALPLLLLAWLSRGDGLAMAFTIALVAVVGVALRLLFRRRRGDVPRAVVTLISGICLYDATLIAAYGSAPLAVLAAFGLAATLALQRFAPGT